ncbi:unnamed protein product [Durusdinium trenchii]|uniref:Uncharacterized protein n=1 Tax=Durusdinium trenchii TaxID=1381693 RepID=A0ABP0IJX4_9DINO
MRPATTQRLSRESAHAFACRTTPTARPSSTAPPCLSVLGMSNIIWGWATLALFHRPLFDATADLLKQRSSEGDLGEVLSEWKAQELSNTAWSFTTVLHVHPASAAMAHAALRRLDEFHARHSANLVGKSAAASDVPTSQPDVDKTDTAGNVAGAKGF